MLLWTAITLGFVHTLLGPDHYVPFIVIGRARRWGLGRVSLLTLACGIGHVLSSVVIGLIGLAAGAALSRVQGWEATRGAWAGWALLLFGVGYLGWGIWRALRSGDHGHYHVHPDGAVHRHPHDHAAAPVHPPVHEHPHAAATPTAPEAVPWRALTPWLLFLIFVLGPCEPLVPLFFASAVAGSWGQVALVVAGYGLATLAAMHLLVAAFWFGLRSLRLGPVERWSHAVAGGVVAMSGVAMVFLGL
jgi:hypothetical protein